MRTCTVIVVVQARPAQVTANHVHLPARAAFMRPCGQPAVKVSGVSAWCAEHSKEAA